VAGPTQAVGGDDLVTAAPLLERVGDWRAFLSLPADEDDVDILRRHHRTGRPLGGDAFVERLEASLGRDLRPRKPGPKPRKTPREPRDR
jgi:putative transposase